MTKRIGHEVLNGPNGEIVKVSWMPDKRIRFDFVRCGAVTLTKMFPAPGKMTHAEFSYTEGPEISAL